MEPVDAATATTGNEKVLVRWLPSALLDLGPNEPLAALRTPHRVMVQAAPATRDGLAALLRAQPLELVLEVDDEQAPLRHAPVHDVHEARLTPDLPLPWSHYYWLCDGLLEDLSAQPADPAAGFLRGRVRLALVEEMLREARRRPIPDLDALDAAWAAPLRMPQPDVERHGEPQQALQQYLRGLSGHLADHAASIEFVREVRLLLAQAESRRDPGLPALSGPDLKLLTAYAQHRLFAGRCFTAPAGMIAGWHLLFSLHMLAVWYAGLLTNGKRNGRSRDAVLSALWLLEQGLWQDDALVHDVLRNLNASEYTSLELAAGFAAGLQASAVRS